MADKKFLLQTKPFLVPTTDGKRIEEHFGLATTHTSAYSVAHMLAPPHWGEPFQKPEFDEVTLVLRGKKRIEMDEETIDLGERQSILIKAGTRVRYSNPFEEPCEYVSFCVPAFDIATVNREDE
ncbi:cupin domain-containing protein [Adhaeribacter sp. BT258]|uniref:Cupin domain-containing protein n=1 Tax=Adhaeribacter terrigena TaxID=2793070 RepID=A0ABS1BXF1_9BACT|nr:cupin domain-containing protein [Adhaeribacter terrigena]MBK0401769.1 cupin domain-containing protein [Adhaeribacter terrigena]